VTECLPWRSQAVDAQGVGEEVEGPAGADPGIGTPQDDSTPTTESLSAALRTVLTPERQSSFPVRSPESPAPSAS